MKTPGFLIAAAASGSGKTVISCGLMQAYLERGVKIAGGKCGPDYIDPMFHREVLGVDSLNLDLFFYERDQLRRLLERHAEQADLFIAEGVMGYYDGMGIDTDRASSYDVASALDIPAVLVMQCRGSALSAAALAIGFLEFRKDSKIRGIILNRISGSIYPRMKDMLERELLLAGFDVKVVGYVPENPVFALESRHLGLVTPEEIRGLKDRLAEAGRILSETVDLDLLLELAGNRGEGETLPPEALKISDALIGNENLLSVAVAKDEAFCFYYKDNLERLKQAGLNPVPFSPLRDRKLPDGVCGLILGGGYPELHAAALSANGEMLGQIRRAVQDGMPCHAECGGFLYLLESLQDKEGNTYPMAGVIPGNSYPQGRLSGFGYIRLSVKEDSRYLKKGEEIKGHEFHYWKSSSDGSDAVALKPDGKRSWECMHAEGNLLAGFPHLCYASLPEFTDRFADAAEKYRIKKEG